MTIIATVVVTLVSALFVATALAPTLIEMTARREQGPNLVLIEGGADRTSGLAPDQAA